MTDCMYMYMELHVALQCHYLAHDLLFEDLQCLVEGKLRCVGCSNKGGGGAFIGSSLHQNLMFVVSFVCPVGSWGGCVDS